MTTIATPGVKKCSNCGKWKHQSAFSASSDSTDGLQAWCKKCHSDYKDERKDTTAKATHGPKVVTGELKPPTSDLQKAAHALSLFPVTAYTPDGGEEVTTVAKALGLDELAKQEARAEWAEAANEIGKMIKSFQLRHPGVAEMAKQARPETAGRLRSSVDDFGRMVADYKHRRLVATIAGALTKQARVEKVRKELAPLKAKTAKKLAKAAEMERRAEASALGLIEAERQLAKTIEESNVIGQGIAELSKRVDAVYARAEAGYKAVQLQECRKAAALKAREERESADWTFKANTTNDPVLRAAYMARAEGRDIEDDEY